MLFSPAVGFALVLPAVGFALVLPAVGCALVLFAVGCALVLPAVGYVLSVLLIFPCCWVCSSRGHRTRVASFLLLTTDSLAVVSSLLPLITGSLAVMLSLFSVFWRRLLQHYFVEVYCSEVRLKQLAPLRDHRFAEVLGFHSAVVYNNVVCCFSTRPYGSEVHVRICHRETLRFWEQQGRELHKPSEQEKTQDSVEHCRNIST